MRSDARKRLASAVESARLTEAERDDLDDAFLVTGLSALGEMDMPIIRAIERIIARREAGARG